MPVSIEDYCYDFINKLLFAQPRQAVQTYILKAIKELKDFEVNNYGIKKFLDITIQHLEKLSPLDYNYHQWANIKAGKIILNRYKISFSQQAMRW